MHMNSFRNLAVAAAVAAGLMFHGVQPAQADMSKEQVEQIVHEYIMNHADEILQSVNDFQKKDMSERTQKALSENRDEIYDDGTSPYIGNKNGDVTVVEFFDYNCHFCKQVFPELKELADKDKGLKIIFKDFPILGPTSETSAKWALAAQKQGKYFPFHQEMMNHNGPISDEVLQKVAKDIGLDLDKAKHDIDGTDVLIQIQRNRILAGKMNFNGTPSFIVGDEAFSSAISKDDLVEKIAAARAQKKDGDKKDGDKKDE